MSQNYIIPHILIVDDEADIVEINSHYLSQRGMHCVTCCDPHEALDLLKTHHFDAILCDIKMPGLNGLELLAEARKVKINTPFVFLTAAGNEFIMTEALRLGASGFLDKPCRSSELHFAVLKALKTN